MMRDLQNRRDFFRGLKTHRVKLGKGLNMRPNERLVPLSAKRHHQVACSDVRDVRVHGKVNSD